MFCNQKKLNNRYWHPRVSGGLIMEAVAYKISSKEEADRIVAECNGTVIEVK